MRVEDGELYVGTAHLPLEFVGEVEVFGAKDKRRILGPRLDPAAHVLHRGWVGPIVRVRVTDPDGPDPRTGCSAPATRNGSRSCCAARAPTPRATTTRRNDVKGLSPVGDRPPFVSRPACRAGQAQSRQIG